MTGFSRLSQRSELVVGENRFAFGLLKAGKFLEGADVKLRLYDIDGGEAKLAAELRVPYQAVKNVKQERSVHRHADGTEHVHGDDSGIRGLYVAQLNFARAGDWGVELLVSQASGAFEPVRFAVTVQSHQPRQRSVRPAPRSHNLIASDVKNLRQSIPARSPIPACIRFESLTRSRKENRNLLSSPRRSSAPAACVGRS